MPTLDEMEFDKTRKAIKTGQLDDSARKEMLEKFTGAGGQVLREGALRREEGSGSSGNGGRGARGGSDDGDFKMPSEIAREKQRKEQERQLQQLRHRERLEKQARSFFARFGLKLSSQFKGIAGFGSSGVNPAFMSKLNLDLKRVLMECHILGNDLFASNSNVARAIIRHLDSKSPIFVETIERATKLYDRHELNELIGSYSAGSSEAVPFSSVRGPLHSVLRKIYYLAPYVQTYLTAVEMAVEVQQKEEKKNALLYSTKIKKIRKEWNLLMFDLFPDMALLAQRIDLFRAEPATALFEQMIGVRNDQKLGKRKAGEGIGEVVAEAAIKADEQSEEGDEELAEGNESESAADGTDAADETATTPPQKRNPNEAETASGLPAEEEQKKTSPIARGLAIMSELSIPELRAKHDSKGELLGSLDDNDKILITYLFFMEFEQEYAFVLTSQRIKLNSVSRGGTKFDMRQRLGDVAEHARKPHSSIKSYIAATLDLREVSDKTPSADKYIDHAKKVELLQGKRGVASQQLRKEIKEYMSKLSSELATLLKDIDGAKEIVENPKDVIVFDSRFEKARRLNKSTVKLAITNAFCYSRTLAQRIDKGDLFGGILELSDNEFARFYPSSIRPKGPSGATVAPASGTAGAGESISDEEASDNAIEIS